MGAGCGGGWWFDSEFREAVKKKNGKISDKCQITSYPLPPQPNNDKTNSDKKLKV